MSLVVFVPSWTLPAYYRGSGMLDLRPGGIGYALDEWRGTSPPSCSMRLSSRTSPRRLSAPVSASCSAACASRRSVFLCSVMSLTLASNAACEPRAMMRSQRACASSPMCTSSVPEIKGSTPKCAGSKSGWMRARRAAPALLLSALLALQPTAAVAQQKRSERFAAVADRFAASGRHGKADGTLAGTITLTAGLGGMGGAQPLAVTMNDGVAICIECDDTRIKRRIEHRYLDVQADSLDHALELAVEARDARRPLSIGVLGNAAEMVPELLAREAPIDIVTDQTSAHDPLYYLPAGVAFEDWADLREKDPAGLTEREAEMVEQIERQIDLLNRQVLPTAAIRALRWLGLGALAVTLVHRYLEQQ